MVLFLPACKPHNFLLSSVPKKSPLIFYYPAFILASPRQRNAGGNSYRNEKVCKMITARHRLHFANGKDSIKEERLRPYDKAKHAIYKALNEELPKATDWNEPKTTRFPPFTFSPPPCDKEAKN